jgi:uncharacterized protein
MSTPPDHDETAPGVPPRGAVSAAVEAAIVLGIGSSPFIASAILSGGAGNVDAPLATELSDTLIFGTLAVQLSLAVILLPIVRWRGWRIAQVAGAPEPPDIVRGTGVWLLSMAAYMVSFVLWHTVTPDTVDQLRHVVPTGSVSLAAAVSMSLVNPMFEEFLFLGFGVNALRRFGLPVACAVSLALRTAAHLYQGPMAIVGILPLGLAYTVYYARTGRLWPVVVAHVIQDSLALAVLTTQ